MESTLKLKNSLPRSQAFSLRIDFILDRISLFMQANRKPQKLCRFVNDRNTLMCTELKVFMFWCYTGLHLPGKLRNFRETIYKVHW